MECTKQEEGPVAFLILPGGNVIVRSARVLGTMNPPPTPVNARMAHRAMKFVANPDAIEHAVHHADAKRITLAAIIGHCCSLPCFGAVGPPRCQNHQS